MKKILLPILIVFLIAIFYVYSYTKNQPVNENSKSGNVKTNMKITSPAFTNNQNIPPKYTCNGENINPPLEFTDIPAGTKSLTLIVDDPDAPMGTWVHWVVYNINPEITKVAENTVPAGGIEAKTTPGTTKYGGPCPASGTHRYFFKLYALNKKLSIKGTGDKNTLLKAMNGAVIASSELIGLYHK